MVSPQDERFPQTMKKIGILAVLLALILYIINRVRNEVTIETDIDE